MMKNNTVKNALVFLLSLVMLFSLPLCCGAAEKEKYTVVKWTLDENAENLYGNGKQYTRYSGNGTLYSDSDTLFYFMNEVEFNGEDCWIYGESAYPHFINMETSDGYSFVFADEEGRQILDRFLTGTDCIYYLELTGMYTVMDEPLVQSLDEMYYASDANLTEMTVGSLSEGLIYDLTAHDSTLSMAYEHGAVYVMANGDTYYLCFEELPNTYFDADGFFSYRRGSVDVLKLEGELLNTVKKALNSMDDRDINYLYEASVVNGIYDINGNYIEDIGFDFGFDFYGDGEYSITTFWVFFALLGFAVPLVILVLGLLFARSKKMGKNSFWYALSGFGAAWILAAAGIMLLLL